MTLQHRRGSGHKRDVVTGLRIGFYMAVIYSIVATAIMLGAGFASKLTLWEYLSVVVAYFVSGLAGGATAGMLKELSRTWLGTALTGAAVGASVFLAMCTTMFGLPWRWGTDEWWTYAVSVLVVSPIAALYYRRNVDRALG
jgi:hypothetical protein